MWNASRTIMGMSCADCTRKLCLVTAWVMPVMSASWKASVPMDGVATCPVMHTMGTESMYASARGVTTLVPPGPLVTMATPGRPVTCA